MRRRAFLGVVSCTGATALSGCSEFLNQSENIIDENNRIVRDGEYRWWEFTLNTGSELTLSTVIREG